MSKDFRWYIAPSSPQATSAPMPTGVQWVVTDASPQLTVNTSPFFGNAELVPAVPSTSAATKPAIKKRRTSAPFFCPSRLHRRGGHVHTVDAPRLSGAPFLTPGRDTER